MALAAQALEAQKASKPLEQGGALEQVAARMKRVMGLTPHFSRGFDTAKRWQIRRLEVIVGHWQSCPVRRRCYTNKALFMVKFSYI